MIRNRIQTCRIPRGVSLIELLLVISLISVIFTVGITTLGFLMRVEMKGTSRIQETLTLQKLSQQFREDAAMAENAVISGPNKNKLLLELDSGNSIIYSGNQNRNAILRVKKQDDKIITRNEFHVPEDSLQFTIEKRNHGRMVFMSFRILPEQMHENRTVKQPGKSFNLESLVNRKNSIQSRVTQSK